MSRKGAILSHAELAQLFARAFPGLGSMARIEAAAHENGVSANTIRNWLSGATRAPLSFEMSLRRRLDQPQSAIDPSGLRDPAQIYAEVQARTSLPPGVKAWRHHHQKMLPWSALWPSIPASSILPATMERDGLQWGIAEALVAPLDTPSGIHVIAQYNVPLTERRTSGRRVATPLPSSAYAIYQVSLCSTVADTTPHRSTLDTDRLQLREAVEQIMKRSAVR